MIPANIIITSVRDKKVDKHNSFRYASEIYSFTFARNQGHLNAHCTCAGQH